MHLCKQIFEHDGRLFGLLESGEIVELKAQYDRNNNVRFVLRRVEMAVDES